MKHATTVAYPLLAALAVLAVPSWAAPALRFRADLRGDVVVIGQTLGHDCDPALLATPPLVGAVGPCGTALEDRAMDVLWRADAPDAGLAQSTLNPLEARTTAVLALPSFATVAHARLYWSASGPVDAEVSLERPGSFEARVVAQQTVSALGGYQASADVSELVREHGRGAWRVSGFTPQSPTNVSTEQWAAWHLVVVYALDGAAPRSVTLLDGLDEIGLGVLADGGVGNKRVAGSLGGFLAPDAGAESQLAVVGYLGDVGGGGDSVRLDGVALSNRFNPADDFFNGTRSGIDGGAATRRGDLPWLAGSPGTHAGLDLDQVSVGARLPRGTTSTVLSVETVSDRFVLGGLMAAFATVKPTFNGTVLSAVDVNGGAAVPGDVVEWTMAARNGGNDVALGTQLVVRLSPEHAFVPGSLRIVASPVAAQVAAQSDAFDADLGDYDGAKAQVAFDVGVGAVPGAGGALRVGEAVTVSFRTTLLAGAPGRFASANGWVVSEGQSAKARGLAAAELPTSPPDGAFGPTRLPIDACARDADCTTPGLSRCDLGAKPNVCVACRGSADCAASAPVCDVATHACVKCTRAADCSDPARPICSTDAPTLGQCVQCTSMDGTRCVGASNRCEPSTGSCVSCTSNSECPVTAPRCDPTTRTCQGCTADAQCSGATPACSGGRCVTCTASNTSRCTAPTPACDVDRASCVACTSDAHCAGATPKCALDTQTCVAAPAMECTATSCAAPTPICDPTTKRCIAAQCSSDSECSGATPRCGPNGVCVGCVDDSSCPGSSPKCGPAGVCVACVDGSECPGATACDAHGRCVQCLDDSACSGATPSCDASGQCVACTNGDACPPVPTCDDDDDCGPTEMCSAHATCVPCDGSRCVSDQAFFGGAGACSSAGGLFAWLVVLFPWWRRRRWAALAAVVALPVLAQTQTGVPGFELEQLQLNPGAQGSLWAMTGDVLEPGSARLSAWLGYQKDPLVLNDFGVRQGALIGTRLTTHLTGAWAPVGWLEVGFQAPLVVLQQGDDLSAKGFGTPASFAMGTPWLQARVAPLRQRDGMPVDVAVHLGVGLPVGTPDAFTRDGFVAFNPKVGVGRAFGWLRVGLEGGAQLRNGLQTVTLSPESTTKRDELGSRFEGAAVISTVGLPVMPELGVRVGVPFSKTAVATELLAGVRIPLGRIVELHALAGPGFGTMPGVPTFRALGGLSVGGVDHERCRPNVTGVAGCDDDRDGVRNEADLCPLSAGLAERGGCPWLDRDADGVEDQVDHCPDIPGRVDVQGCPPKDRDRDGVEDGADACPNEPGLPTLQGCPVRDADGDGVLDASDRCPNEAGPAETGGCPKPQLVVVTEEALEISERVFFASGKALILPRSFPLLREVAQVLAARPRLGVEVQGHTDAQGQRSANVALSKARAQAVRDFLVREGIDEDRLTAEGYGPDKPVASNRTEAGRAKNRRVDFVIRTPPVPR